MYNMRKTILALTLVLTIVLSGLFIAPAALTAGTYDVKIKLIRVRDGSVRDCGELIIEKGESVKINITAPSINTRYGEPIHEYNYSITVLDPEGHIFKKWFGLKPGEQTTFTYPGDFTGATTRYEGTYTILVHEYYFDEYGNPCVTLRGECTFIVELELNVSVRVYNATMEVSGKKVWRCDTITKVNATIFRARTDTPPKTPATVYLTIHDSTGVPLGSWGMTQIDNTTWEATINMRISSTNPTGDWIFVVEATDSEGYHGRGSTYITVVEKKDQEPDWVKVYKQCGKEEPTFLDVNSTIPRCVTLLITTKLTECDGKTVTGKNGTATAIIQRKVKTTVTICDVWEWVWDPVAGEYVKECKSSHEETRYTWVNVASVPMSYDYDDKRWEALWDVPLDFPVGDMRINVTASDNAVKPNTWKSRAYEYKVTKANVDVNVSFDKDSYERCETITITAKARYDCCNKPFTGTGTNVTAVLSYKGSFISKVYLSDTGKADSEGYEIWRGTYKIKLSDPAFKDAPKYEDLQWDVIVRAFDSAEPVNEGYTYDKIPVKPATIDVKASMWSVMSYVKDDREECRAFIYMCISGTLCGEKLNDTYWEDSKKIGETIVEVTLYHKGKPFLTVTKEQPPAQYRDIVSRILWSEDTKTWCFNVCISCLGLDYPGVWNATVKLRTVFTNVYGDPNEGTRKVATPVAILGLGSWKEKFTYQDVEYPVQYRSSVVWLNMDCPIRPYTYCGDGRYVPAGYLYFGVNQTTPLYFNVTVIDGALEAESVTAEIWKYVDGTPTVVVPSITLQKVDMIKDEKNLYPSGTDKYMGSVTPCLSPGTYYVKVKVTYPGTYASDPVECCLVCPGCPVREVCCPAIPSMPEVPNNVVEGHLGRVKVAPIINAAASKISTAAEYNPGDVIAFEGIIKDVCAGLKDATVSIKVKDPDGVIIFTDEVTTTTGGALPWFGFSLPVNAKLGTYTWEAEVSYGKNYAFYEARTPFTVSTFGVEKVKLTGSFKVVALLKPKVYLTLPSWVYSDSVVKITADVYNEATGAKVKGVVSGEVVRPDGVKDTLTFTEVAPGTYSATYKAPGIAGTYVVSVKATVDGKVAEATGSFYVEIKPTPVTPPPVTIPPVTPPPVTTTVVTTVTPPPVTTTVVAPVDLTPIYILLIIAIIISLAALAIILRKVK